MEHRLLIGKTLPDTIADGDAAVLQLEDTDRDPVDVKHEIRPPVMVALESHFLGDGEVVLLGLLPAD